MPDEALPFNRPVSDPTSTGSTSRPPESVVHSTAVLSTQERTAVLKALDEADKPLIPWQLADRAQISQQRIEEIIPILVDEGFVKGEEINDAVRYYRA